MIITTSYMRSYWSYHNLWMLKTFLKHKSYKDQFGVNPKFILHFFENNFVRQLLTRLFCFLHVETQLVELLSCNSGLSKPFIGFDNIYSFWTRYQRIYSKEAFLKARIQKPAPIFAKCKKIERDWRPPTTSINSLKT